MTAATLIDDPLIAHARQLLSREGAPAGGEVKSYNLPCLQIAASASDADWMAACDRALAHHPENPAGMGLRVHSLVAPPPPEWAPGREGGAFALERRLRAAGLCGALALPSGMWTFFDPAAGRAVQALRRPGGWSPWEVSAPLRLPLAWACLASGHMMVHGATLGHRGRGILIAGKGGAGKSGTTLAGVLAGLDTAGDDYVLIDRTMPGFRAWPLYRLAKQGPAGLARLGLSVDGVENWQGKIEFDIRELGAGQLMPSGLRAIVLPRIRHGARCRFVAVSPREAMLALAPSSLFQLPGNPRQGLTFLGDLVRALPAFRLELGTDPAEIGQALGDFIAGLPG